jgi:hypothetical protein
MQVCTPVSGETAVMASGKPLSPSTSRSGCPPLRGCAARFMTFNQGLAPSFCSIQMWHDPGVRQFENQNTKETAELQL